MLRHVPLDHHALRDPVDLADEPLGLAVDQRVERLAPLREQQLRRSRRRLGARRTARSSRSTRSASRSPRAPDRSRASPSACSVVSWLISRIARIGFSSERSRITVFALDHPQHEVGDADLHERRPLAHVRVADDHVEAPEALGVGVRLVAGVDDRARCGSWRSRRPPRCARRAGRCSTGRRAGRAAPCPAPHQICRVTKNGISTSAMRANSPWRADEVVLVAAVGVARGVGVVLEQVDLPVDALLVQAHLGRRRGAPRGSAPPPCRAPRPRGRRRIRASRTRDASRRRGTGARRSRGRRWTSAPSARPGGTGTGRPRRATGVAARGTCR